MINYCITGSTEMFYGIEHIAHLQWRTEGGRGGLGCSNNPPPPPPP